MASRQVSNAGLPTAADLDKVADEQKTVEATAGASPEGAPVPDANTSQQAALATANKTPNSHLAADTSLVDSVGKPKEGGKPVPIGGRGVNAPRDAKPAPSDKEKRSAQPKIIVTDKVDSAGHEKPGQGTEHHLGIRGSHSVRDTYRT